MGVTCFRRMFGDKWHRFIYGPDAVNNVKALKETQSTDMNRRKLPIRLTQK